MKLTQETIVWQGRIRKWRAAAGLTQEQAAACCNVNVRTWQRWEAGASCPSPRKATFYLAAVTVAVAEAEAEAEAEDVTD